MASENNKPDDLVYVVNNTGTVLKMNSNRSTGSNNTVSRVFAATESLVKNLQSGQIISQSADLKSIVGAESLNVSSSSINSATNALSSYASSITTNPAQQKNIMDAARAYLVRNAGSNASAYNKHFNSAPRDNIISNAISTTINSVYAPNLRQSLTYENANINSPSAAMEAYGANVNDLATDIKTGLAINVAQGQTALVNKLVHPKSVTTPYVSYEVTYGQVYDMLKSNDPSGEVREEGGHLKPLIDLEFNPRDVANELRPIIVKKSNDKNNCVYQDGYIVPGSPACYMMDLALGANEFGNNHLNYTDVMSEGVTIKSVVIQLKTNTNVTWAQNKTEKIEIDLSNRSNTRLMMSLDTVDSGIRQATGAHSIRLTKDTKTVEGQESTILSKCTDTDLIKLECLISAIVSLKNSKLRTAATASVDTYTTNEEVHSDVSTLAKNLEVSVLGLSFNAYYSEENVRKSNVAVRTHTRTFTFEIVNGRNFLIDYSLTDTNAEATVNDSVIQYATAAANIGVDHTAIHVIVDQLKWIYARNMQERASPHFYDPMERVNYTCVAGMNVVPTSIVGTIDLSEIDTIRSSDITGDIRQAVEYDLISFFAQFYQNSLYRKRVALGGEAPRFRVLTSPLALTLVFNIPHIHNHLNANDEGGDNNEYTYRRVLPDGTILEFVTSNFAYLYDKVIIVPYRDNADDVTNFGINADAGTFCAHYNPQYENGVNKRLLLNSRSMVVTTNPSGMVLAVAGMDKIANIANEVAIIDDSLPDPADLIRAPANQ